MMKKTICTVFLLACAIVCRSQTDTAYTLPWCDNFEGGSSADWIFTDFDGNNLTWSISDYDPYNGYGSLFGPSYTNHTENNWAIGPKIKIPQNSQDVVMTWKVFAHNNYSETYEVRVTTGDGTDTSEFGMLYGETVSGGYYDRELDLSDYAGSTIRIAFRHNSTFQNYLCIDAVCITSTDHQLEPPSVEIDAPDSAIVNTDVVLTALSYDADSYIWDIEGASVSSATSQRVVVSWPNAGRYAVKVTATNSDGSTTATKHIAIVDRLGISGEQCRSLTLAPNPTSGIVHIDADAVQNIEVRGADGRLVPYGIAAEHKTLDLSPLPAGIYIVRIVLSDGVRTARIVKK